jgi:hypothetical protein
MRNDKRQEWSWQESFSRYNLQGATQPYYLSKITKTKPDRPYYLTSDTILNF